MGVPPPVAAATAATMILFTTSAASVSFEIFGLLEPWYGAAFFFLGIACTAVGQGAMNSWMKTAGRQSPPALSIGGVTAISTILVGLEAYQKFWAAAKTEDLFAASHICSQVE
mmetsp:Transcript_47080/g.97727  ORF Transcript_47080/g.97727 Transcript_47080/m.97727 type:complete len:113 (+) Transcript_47080:2-340(+)